MGGPGRFFLPSRFVWSGTGESVLDVKAKFESFECLDHLSELLQVKQLAINDECNFAIRIGDPAAQSSVRHFEFSGLSLLNMPCSKSRFDSSANAPKRQVGTYRIELSEGVSLSIFPFFLCVHAKSEPGGEIRDDKVSGLTGAVGKRLPNGKVLFWIIVVARFVGMLPTAV